MKHSMLKPVLLLTLTLLIALPSFAQANRGSRGDRSGRGIETLGVELNLTAEQELKMEDLRYSRESTSIELRANIQQERLKLRKLRQSNDLNKKKLYAQIEKVSDAEVKLDKSRVDHLLKVRAILDDDQFKTFSQTMQRRYGPREGQRGDRKDRRSMNSRQDRF